MNLQMLRHVVLLARHRNFTRAADALGISQSALSRSIQQLESAYHLRLFDRDRGGARPTAAGQALIDRAVAMLDSLDDLDQLLRRTAGDEEGEVAFGMAPLPCKIFLTGLLADALVSRPGISNHVAVRSADALLTMLLAEEIEFFVCTDRQIAPGARVSRHAIGHVPVSMLVRAGHPLLQASVDMTGAPWPLLNSYHLDAGAATDSLRFLLSGQQHVVEDHATLSELARRTDAIWLTSPFAASEEMARGELVEYKTEAPPIHVNLLMCSAPRRSTSPAAMRIRRWMETRLRQLQP